MPTQKEIAEAAGLSPAAVCQWFKKDKSLREVLTWPLEDAVNWVKEWQAANHRPTYKDASEPKADGTPQEQLLAAQIRKTNAEAEAKELKNAERRKELLEAAAVELAAAELTGKVRARLESWPHELESEWPAEVRALVTERLADRVYLLLVELSQMRITDGV